VHAFGAERAKYFEAVRVGEHDVEDQQVEGIAERARDTALGILGHIDGIAVLRQPLADVLPGGRVVLDVENPKQLRSSKRANGWILTAAGEVSMKCAAFPRPLTIQEIARAEGLSPDYTAKLLRELRRGGLVSSRRGAAGGYRLTREPEEISVWDAIQVLGGSLFPDRFCECHPGQHPLCVRGSDCSIRSIWRLVDDAVRGVLSRITLRDLHRAEISMGTWLETPPQPSGRSQ
jgi:Rrf2 family protein